MKYNILYSGTTTFSISSILAQAARWFLEPVDGLCYLFVFIAFFYNLLLFLHSTFILWTAIPSLVNLIRCVAIRLWIADILLRFIRLRYYSWLYLADISYFLCIFFLFLSLSDHLSLFLLWFLFILFIYS